MTIAEYKQEHDLTLKALTDELRVIDPRIDMPLVSKMVNGIVRPSETIQQYLDWVPPETLFANTLGGFSSKLEVDIASIIFKTISEHSKANPATRELLRIRTGKPDRVVRRGIEELRRRGVRIVSQSGHYGYWLDSKGGGYEAMRSEMRAKAFSLLATIAKMNANELEGQMTWGELRG